MSSSSINGKKRARSSNDNGKRESEEAKGGGKKSSGLDEIESLFGEKKKQKKQDAEAEKAAIAAAKKKKQQQKKIAAAEAADGGTGKNTHARSKSNASGDGGGKTKWIDDGLGGVYNSEGFTGRNEDGVRIFKAHLLGNKPNFGTSKDCPFDCDCCFI